MDYYGIGRVGDDGFIARGILADCQPTTVRELIVMCLLNVLWNENKKLNQNSNPVDPPRRQG